MSFRRPRHDLAAFRAQIEPTKHGIAFLNHAGMSPLPLTAKQAMSDAISQMAESGSASYDALFVSTIGRLKDCLCRMLSVTPEEIAFVENTSVGLNIVAQGLRLQPGQTVIVCDAEFPSNIYAWQNLESKGVKTRIIQAVDGGVSIDSLEMARDSSSKVVTVSAVQFLSGRREDLTAIGEYCRVHNLWLIVDAMQAAGVMPIDMEAMNISALVCGGQKSIMGPPGQGFMVIRSNLIDQMSPVIVGPLSVIDHEFWLNYDLTLKPNAQRFDTGTSNIVGLVGLLASVELLMQVGLDNIEEWVTYLSDVAIDDLTAKGYRTITPLASREHAHIVTFAIDAPERAIAFLRERGIVVRAHKDRSEQGYLRISSHGYNTVEEVLSVGNALEGLKS